MIIFITIDLMLFILTLKAIIFSNFNGLRTTLLIMISYGLIQYPNNLNFIITVISLGN